MRGHEVRKLTALEDTHWWYAERRHLLARSIAGRPPGRAPRHRCGRRGNTRVLQSAGWEVAGPEYGEEGRSSTFARARGGARRRDGPSGRRQQLDLVVAYDVEHIVDHDAAVRQVRRVLRPDGVFQIAVPADPRLWSEHDVAVDHASAATPGPR